MKSTLPDELHIPGVGVLHIEQRKGMKPDEWGFVDHKNETLVINRAMPEVAKHVTLLREVLTISENILGPDEVFADAAPIILLFMLTQMGLYTPLTHDEVGAFIVETGDAR